MSPLNKMKSLSQAGGTTGRFIKALAKLTFGWGHRKSSLQRGVSLHLSRQVPVSGWTQKGLPGQPSSWPPTAGTPGWTDGDTQGKRRWEENCHPGWSREAAGSPQGRGLALPRFPPETRGPCPRRFQFGESPRPGHTAKRLTHAAPTLLRGCCESIRRNDGEL